MKNVAYRYTIRGNYATDYRGVPFAVEEGNGLMVNPDLQRDKIIGGVCKEIKEQGSLVVFPSYIHHRVKPITKGKRYSLVVWFCGEPFR